MATMKVPPVVKASSVWWGPEVDVYHLFAEPFPVPWRGDCDDAFSPDIELLRQYDDLEQPTGCITGLEIIGFLTFEDWDALPKLQALWRLPGQEPLPLEALLRREQRRLREQATAGQPLARTRR